MNRFWQMIGLDREVAKSSKTNPHSKSAQASVRSKPSSADWEMSAQDALRITTISRYK